MTTIRLLIIVIESSQHMFNHHKQISGMKAIVDKMWLWRNCVKKTVKQDRFLAKV